MCFGNILSHRGRQCYRSKTHLSVKLFIKFDEKNHLLPQNNPSLETNFLNILFQHNVIVFHQITMYIGKRAYQILSLEE